MKLSPGTRKRIAILFEAQDVAEATRRIETECGTNLAGWGSCDARGLERIRYAALKLSDGSLAKLAEAIALAQLDWRDALVASEFADDTEAHTHWLPRPRDE
jgi:hypothetical protein